MFKKSYTFSLCYRSRKNDSVNGLPDNVVSRRNLTKIAASVFGKDKAISKIFLVINHQYMDILLHEEAD